MLDKWRLGMHRLPDPIEDITETEITIENVKKYLEHSDDMQFQTVYLGEHNELSLTLAFFDGMVDGDAVNETALRPIMRSEALRHVKSRQEAFEIVEKDTLYFSTQRTRTTLREVILDILNGWSVLLFDGVGKAVSLETKSGERRSVSESTNESTLKGAKDSFIEIIRSNTGLVRRKIRSCDLRIEQIMVGQHSKSQLALCYMDSAADKNMLRKLKERINAMKLHDILSPGDFEEEIIDRKLSIFPQMMYTERVDRFCSNVMDGKIGVLIDGFPTAFILPGTFNMFFQTPEDYSHNYLISSATRFMRYLAYFLTISVPALFVAVTTYHPEMIPAPLAGAIVRSKQGVPFSTALEVLFVLIAIELLIEAGLRLPQAIGHTVSIVGGLIIGDAAVSAKLLSPAVVVIVAISGIADFVCPYHDLSNAARLCRFGLLIFAAAGGVFGFVLGFIFMLYYLCTIEVLGVPYFVPFTANDNKYLLRDTLIRFPLFLKNKRKKR